METQASGQAQPSDLTPPIAAWQQQAELLAHLCQFSQNILCVVAPPRSGKTEFVKYFMSLSFPSLEKRAISSQCDSVEALMQQIANAFQLSWEQGGTSSQMKESLAHQHQAQASTWVLVVDDADQLSPECLNALLQLSQINAEPRRQLHLILLGSPALEQTLASKENQLIINGFCHTLELAHLSPAKEKTTTPSPKKDEVLLGLDEKQLFNQDRTNSGSLTGVAMAKRQTAAISPRKILSHPITLGALTGVGLGIVYLAMNPLDDAEWQEPVTHASQLAQVHSDYTVKPTLQSPTKKIKVDSGTQVIPEEEQLEELQLNTTKTPLADDIPELALEKSNSQNVKKTSKTTPIQTRNKSPEKQSQRHSLEEQNLLASNAEYYTLQLMGGRSKSGIKDFIQNHDIADKALTYRKQVNGDDWYVVVLGQYQTKEAAQSAIKQLPTSVQKETKPWIRSVGSVQKEIQQN